MSETLNEAIRRRGLWASDINALLGPNEPRAMMGDPVNARHLEVLKNAGVDVSNVYPHPRMPGRFMITRFTN